MTNQEEKPKVEINTHNIKACRYYKHYKGGTYFVNGFVIHEKSGKTAVIYTDGFNSLSFVRFAEEFVEKVEGGQLRFTLMEKK